MQKRTIQIPMGAKIGPNQKPIYGYAERIAYCAGGLAVHKTGEGARWKWMVTHEASGLAIERIGAMTKATALENMQKALALDFDWSQGEAETLDALRSNRCIVDAITEIGDRD